MESGRPVRYVGFWWRLGAAVIDMVLLDFLSFFVFPPSQASPAATTESMMAENMSVAAFLAFSVLILWWLMGTTPGKWITRIRIVDAETFQRPSRKAFAVRFFGYFLSWFAFFIGFVQIALNENHRGFHDRLAGTAVIRIVRA